MRKLLLLIAVFAVVLGVAWQVSGILGLGRLPGDFEIVHDGMTIRLPVVTGLIVGSVLAALMWLFSR